MRLQLLFLCLCVSHMPAHSLTPGKKTALWGIGTLAAGLCLAISYWKAKQCTAQLYNTCITQKEKEALKTKISVCYAAAGTFFGITLVSSTITLFNFIKWQNGKQPDNNKILEDKLYSGEEVWIIPHFLKAKIIKKKLPPNRQVLTIKKDGKIAYSQYEEMLCLSISNKKIIKLKPILMYELNQNVTKHIEESRNKNSKESLYYSTQKNLCHYMYSKLLASEKTPRIMDLILHHALGHM